MLFRWWLHHRATGVSIQATNVDDDTEDGYGGFAQFLGGRVVVSCGTGGEAS